MHPTGATESRFKLQYTATPPHTHTPPPPPTHLKGHPCVFIAFWWPRSARWYGPKAGLHPALQGVQVLTPQHHQGHARSTVVVPAGGRQAQEKQQVREAAKGGCHEREKNQGPNSKSLHRSQQHITHTTSCFTSALSPNCGPLPVEVNDGLPHVQPCCPGLLPQADQVAPAELVVHVARPTLRDKQAGKTAATA